MKQILREKLIVRESFAMAFQGGEIWFEQLDALSIYKELVMEKFQKDMEIIKRPSTTGLIAINLNETEVDTDMIQQILGNLAGVSNLQKVVFVGLSNMIKRYLKRWFSQTPVSFVCNCIDDYEKAKLWLVGR
ncbi:hypothetical protein acsn021_12770 [Anaerocolumna cellulosilytica]|uniref:Uncharacterized protein n=1 Tax=Anaerocolumna cellulosilytica TaxID=433286 RepID=A0A6S6R3T6_9FIRM|nr:hypothetical protein [Anaerocolumna cellulosilytica]MBB5195994.1 hypothetical protein [Anaerocolumna cellulosilytica]BCJ93708.1 hypothetical protein acsn021_12770 [Anaerocolumna cellulosilytica]